MAWQPCVVSLERERLAIAYENVIGFDAPVSFVVFDRVNSTSAVNYVYRPPEIDYSRER